MQNEPGLYEMPADRLIFTHEGLAASRELGEAEIVSTIWGNPRVRIVSNQSKPGVAWLLGAVAALGIAAIAWLALPGPESGDSEPRTVIAPPAPSPAPAPTVSAPGTAVQTNPEVQHAHTPPAPAMAAEAPPTAGKPAQSVAEARAKRELAGDRHARAKPAQADNADQATASAHPPSAGAQGALAKQPDAANSLNAPAPASTATADKPEPTAVAPVKPEQPAMSGATDSNPGK